MKRTKIKSFISNSQLPFLYQSYRQQWLINITLTPHTKILHKKYTKLHADYIRTLKTDKTRKLVKHLPMRGQRTRSNANTARKLNGYT